MEHLRKCHQILIISRRGFQNFGLAYQVGLTIKLILFNVPFWHVVALQLRPPDSSSGVADQQSVVLSPSRDTCVLKQELNHDASLGHKAIGTMCSVTHVNEPSALIEKRKGFAPWFLV